MKIDPRSHIPIYRQIADGICESVAAGVFAPGEALPSLRALAVELKVNPNTVQKAYDHLAREGLVYARRGRGLFVSEQGAASAQDNTLRAVQITFQQGIRTGQAAGISEEAIRGAFAAALDTVSEGVKV